MTKKVEKTGLKTALEYAKSCSDLQWRRKEMLESKAINLISLTGMIIGIFTTMSIYLLDRITARNCFYISSFVFIIGIVLFLFAAYEGIETLKIKEYVHGPPPEEFTEKWSNTQEKNAIIALERAIVFSSKKNSDLNDDKADYLEKGYKYLICGLLTILLFFISLIIGRVFA